MARDIENVNITLPGESDTIILNVDGEPTKVTVALDNWQNADAELDADSKNAIQNRAVAEALDQKVDKVSGKGLSKNDYTDADKTKLADLPTDADLTAELARKVDKETGKGLSTNDYTTEEKNKLSGIESGAQVNTITGVKGNSETSYRTGNVNITKANIGLGNVDNTADADKPISTATQTALSGKVDKVTGKGLSSNDFTTEEKNKLAGIEAGAEVNVQANWNESDQTSDAFIQNKPSIPSKTSELTNDSGFVTNTAMQSALDQKVDKVAGKGLSTEDFTSAEKTKLAGIEAGAQVNTITGVKGDAEAAYRTGDVNITKANIGLGNVDNTSDLDKPISTATQTALDGKQNTLTFDTTPTAGSTNPVTSDGIAAEISALNSNLSQKVSSVNGETPDTNGNVEIDATDIETSSGVAIKSVNGNHVTIADALQGNALGVNTTLEPIQSGSGTPSPTNIRPITGRTQVDVTRTGKNLLPNFSVSDFDNAQTYGDSTYIQIPFKAGTYTISTDAPATYLWAGNTANWPSDYARVTSGSPKTITLTSDGRIAFGILTRDKATALNYKTQIEQGSTATEYEPYVTPQAVTVQLGQTVYGGTLNVSTGELSVETANIDSYNGESIGEPWWSSMDEYVAGTLPTTGAQVVYTLATPITVSLTPAQINLLTGTNIISTSADDLLVRYYATGQTGNVEGNIAFLLDKTASNETAVNTVSESIAPTETGTATQNYATGSYLMLNNRLCKVTSAIDTGEQIIVGSNVQYTTVADELKAILAQINA